MTTATQEKVQLETDLHVALEHNQFEVHYQPKVNTKTGVVHGAEALLRWRHPVRGEIQPADFIHIAEECGLIGAIGTWVMAEVTRLLIAQWKALGGGTGTSLPREATSNILGVNPIRALFAVREAAARDILAYWLALALVVAATGGVYWLLRSRLGLALAAVRDNIDAAQSVGVDAVRLKWAVFLIAAAATGLTGALIFLQTARISPDAAFALTDWTANVIFIVVIGGIGTIEGPILGVLVFFVLRSSLADYGSWYLMTLGLIAIAVMLFAPKGLWGLISARTDLHLFPVRRRLVGPKIEGLE